MWKTLLSLILAATLSFAVSAQDEAPADAATADAEAATADDGAGAGDTSGVDPDSELPTGSAAIEDEEVAEEEQDNAVFDEAFEEVDLDEQTYEEDEDDFVPTEEIPADEPIPFPSNI